jgi:hypothetical protein
MFGKKSTSGNGMASTSPSSTFFEKNYCFVYVHAIHVIALRLGEGTIDGFKVRLAQYKQFESSKWEDWVENVFMFSYNIWNFVESISEHKTLTFNCNLHFLYIFEMFNS